MGASRRIAKRHSQVIFLASASLLCSIGCLACLGASTTRPIALPLLAAGLYLAITSAWLKFFWRLRLSWPGWSAGVATFALLAASFQVVSPATDSRADPKTATRRQRGTPLVSVVAADGVTPGATSGVPDSQTPTADSLVLRVDAPVRIDLAKITDFPDGNSIWKQLAKVNAVAGFSHPDVVRGSGAADRLRSIEIRSPTEEGDIEQVLRELAKSRYWLERLDLPTLKDEWIPLLLTFKGLRELTVVGSHAVTDEGLRQLCADPAKQRHMQVLILQAEVGNRNILGNGAIRAASDLRRLRVLELHSSKITGATLDLIAMHLNELSHLNLAHCAIDDRHVPQRWAGRLNYLNLSGCVLQGDALIRVTQSLPGLESIDLSRNRLDSEYLKSLAELTSLRNCSLQSVPGLSEDLARELMENTRNLRFLDLRDNVSLTPQETESLVEFAQQREIQLLIGPLAAETSETIISSN